MPTEHDKAIERMVQPIRGYGSAFVVLPLSLTKSQVPHDAEYDIRKAELKRERKRRARSNPRA